MEAESEKSRGPLLLDFVPQGGIYDPEVILDRFLHWVEATGLEPYPAQEEALLELMAGDHVILSTPTGSGKSLVALGLHFKAMCLERRSFYTAPIKALVSEKFFALCEQFGPENVGMMTGDATINWAAPIICCTAEVLANMSLSQADRTDAPYVVMDEFHYYSDPDRGAAWQIPLLVLPRSNFLLMSATLGDMRAIADRIEATTGRRVAQVHSAERPVPLDFSYRETPLLETVEKLLGERKQPIYIVHFTQREAADQAQGLTSANITDRDEKRRIAEAIGAFRFDTAYGKDMQRFLRHGIGIHHAGLLPKYRLLVEQLAQQGLLKIICGTDTLGVGVNIPIRTVLFTKLCKFDGEKVAILSVRNFNQIAGRAGRKGFDDLGSVVCQAPEHVIENKRLELKAAMGPRKKKFSKKKPPNRGYVPWNADTLERLSTSPSETLRSRFGMNQNLLVSCLQSDAGQGSASAGYRQLLELIALCHEDERSKRRLRRSAAVHFRALRQAGIVELIRDERTAELGVRISADLQEDFSLHHALSVYLIEALDALDPESESYTLDLLTLVESILENPRAILFQLERKAKDELMAELKAERVPYEERIAKLEEVSWPKPNAEFIYASFNLFAEHHPWVGSENIRPKSIARLMYESYSGFNDFVARYGLARMEGLLLRYLSQVANSLIRTVPDSAKTDEVHELVGYLRALLLRVDSSLIQEWESLMNPGAAPAPDPQHPAAPAGVSADPRAFKARVRGECRLLVRALARGDYEEATNCVNQELEAVWDAARFEAALAPFYEQYASISFAPEARQAHHTQIREDGPLRWKVRQVLVDDQADNFWNIEAEIDLNGEVAPDAPLLRVVRIAAE